MQDQFREAYRGLVKVKTMKQNIYFLAGIALSALIILGFLVVFSPYIPQAKALPPTLSTCPVPENAITVGGKWDGSFMWLASYKYGALYKVNMATCNYVQYYYLGVNDTSFSVRFRGMDMDANGNFWIVKLQSGLVFFDKSTSTFQNVITTDWQAQNVKVIAGKVYVGADLGGPFNANDKLYIIDVATKTIDSQISLTGGSSTAYDGYIQVGNNIWMTDNENDRLVRYSTINSTVKNFVYSGVNQPLGLDYSAPYLYMGSESQGKIVAVNPHTAELVKTYNLNGKPYAVKAVSYLGQNYVAYSTWSGTTRGVGVLNFTLIAHTTSVFYCDYDSIANKVYCAYYGSPAGALQGSDFLPIPIPEPQPQPKPPEQGADNRLPILLTLSNSQVVRKGSMFNVSITLQRNVSGFLGIYRGDNFIGEELLVTQTLNNEAKATFLIPASWIGEKKVFALFGGDLVSKHNMSNYITLNSVEPKRGIGVATSAVEVGRNSLKITIRNTDRFFTQNMTALVQISECRVIIVYACTPVYLAVVPMQVSPNTNSTFTLGGDVPRGIVEIFIWKSLKEAIPLAEVISTRN